MILERMVTGMVSLNLNSDPIVLGLVKIGMKSTNGKNVLMVFVNLFLRVGVSCGPTNGNDAYIFILATLN